MPRSDGQHYVIGDDINPTGNGILGVGPRCVFCRIGKHRTEGPFHRMLVLGPRQIEPGNPLAVPRDFGGSLEASLA